METEDLSAHLKTLSKTDWQKLFDLIPEIESTKEFSSGGDVFENPDDDESYIITEEIEAPIVFRFLDVMEELGLIFPFSWTEWEEGKRIFKERKYENLDTITCLKLIFCFIRSDHFSYGAGLASRFQEGTIGILLNEIKKNVKAKNT